MKECPCSAESIELIALGCSGKPNAKENISTPYIFLRQGVNMKPVECRQAGNAEIDDLQNFMQYNVLSLEFLCTEH